MKVIYLALFASLFIVNSPIFFNNLAGIYAQSDNDDTIPIKTRLLYTSDNGNLTSFRMLDTNEPIKTEVSFIEKGILNQTIKVTNQGTFIETHLSDNIVRGEGKGIITTQNAGTISWQAFDSGQISSDGNTIFQGIIFFNTASSEELSYLDNKFGLYIHEVRDDESKDRYIWEWK